MYRVLYQIINITFLLVIMFLMISRAHADTVGSSGLKQSMRKLFPGENIGVEVINHSVALTGSVSSPSVSENAEKVAGEYIGTSGNRKVVNLLKVTGGQQVMLRVRVGEIDRSMVKKFGLGLHAILSGGDAEFGLMENQKLLKILAEPNLTAISGQSARFLAGGEFPVPVKNNGSVSVDYKPFGVAVNYTPTVLSQDRVRLDVESEVSELSNEGAVVVDSLKIPSVSTRRAKTTVELAPGESFMIAGLIKDTDKSKLNQVAGLGEIPILNALFRSTKFQNNQTELVIAVTPYIVNPVDSNNIKLPTDDYVAPTLPEMFFYKRLEGEKDDKVNTGTNSSRLEGPVGYIAN